MARQLPTTRKELRAALAARFAVPSIPDEGWDFLSWAGYIRDYEHVPDAGRFDELVKQVGPFVRKTPGRKPGQPVASYDKMLEPITESEMLRSAAQSLHVARLAAGLRDVHDLREILFGGRTLTDEEAKRLVRQIGPRYFDPWWFAKHEIPLLSHDSYLWDPVLGRNSVWKIATRLRFEWEGGNIDIPGAFRIYMKANRDEVRLKLPDTEFSVSSSSVLGMVQIVAAGLARDYDWDEGAATMFLLTGKRPFTPPIVARSRGAWRGDHNHHFIELRIEPWVSAESVRRTYLHQQRLLSQTQKQTKPIEEKQLILFTFIEMFRERVFGKTWEELHEERLDFCWGKAADEWNKTHGHDRPTWRYKGKRMSRDYHRTSCAIVSPPYGS